MKFILPNCRQQFTPTDFEFISRVLGRDDRQERALLGLLADADTRDRILDEEKLVAALRDLPGCTAISEHCYFYILVRHVLRRAGIDDRRLADYVAEVLVGFTHADNATPRDAEGRPMRYVFEMLAAMDKADDRTRFLIQAHLGNHTLFVTGLFPEHLRWRSDRRGAPGIGYYEGMGRSSFKAASDHRLASRYELDGILADLSEAFGEVRQALNDLTDRVVFMGDPGAGIRPGAFG
ncbi:MAG: hypothetical protein KF833_12075 [Verrucomicrobiae bacterium]|nr:hypothetical protein [Verrucomicrobiae bacterium]